MASYKYSKDVVQNSSDEFDKLYSPGTTTPHSGIYKCNVCSYEAASVEGHPLPPPSDPRHAKWGPLHPGQTKWRLAVFAVHSNS